MKFTNVLVTGLALTTGAQAQGWSQFPPWLMNLIQSMQNNKPAFAVPGPPMAAPPAGPPSAPQVGGGKPASSAPAPAPTTTVTGAASYGGFKSIRPVIPTAPAFVPSSAPVSTSTSTAVTTSTITKSSNGTVATSTVVATSTIISTPGSNSTTNSTVISCVNDAKQNPNLPNSAQHRCNWAPGFDINTNTQQSWPNTYQTVKYTLTITNGTVSPQGDDKIGFLINGQFPGPAITANWGDNLEITVVNNLQNNGTSIHWHGMWQKGSVEADGVNGITQCPIAPGQSYTYKFQATQYGTSWYHSHFSAQYGEGVFGPLIINGPTSYNYDIDLGAVIISDYYPLTAFQEDYYTHRHGPPTATNYLLNGKNAKVDGSGGQRSSWTFTPGKKHKLHVLNVGIDSQYKFQIDGHSLIVVAADLVPIVPYRTNELHVSVGQRYEVIVEANATPGNYFLRAAVAADCAFNLNNGNGTANGIINYSGVPAALPTSKSTFHSNACVDEPANYLQPIVPGSVDSGAFTSTVSSLPIDIAVLQSAGGIVFNWMIGGISQVIDWSNPTLSQAVVNNNTYDAAKHVVQLPTKNVWTYWILQNKFFVPHPIHLHGHDFSLLGSGVGNFDAGANAAQLNFANPPRRDTALVPANGWVVIAFKTDNPGPWLMHCHMAFHVSDGLSLQFLEVPSEIPALYASDVQSSAYQNTCKAWKDYYPNSVWKQSDSGLRRRELINGIDMEVEVMDEIPERRSAEVEKRHSEHLKRHISHWGSQVY